MKAVALKIFIFILLLFFSNLFLLKPGIWFYQDASYWYKNETEIKNQLTSQFHVFSNFSYYHGYDQGILTFTRILDYSVSYVLFNLFGSGGSQIVFSLLGFVVAFFSFYLFSEIFFTEKNTRYLLALFFTFNPLLYSFRGEGGFIYAAAPLFIYSFYKFFSTQKVKFVYLFLNIISVFSWITYIRFVQLNLFIIIPYLLLLFFSKKIKCTAWNVFIYCSSMVFVLSPFFVSIFSLFFNRSPGVFNYATAYKTIVFRDNFSELFTFFQSSNLTLYTHTLYQFAGGILFIIFLMFMIKLQRKEREPVYYVSFSLFLFGASLFGLANIFGDAVYLAVIKFFPFLTNGMFYSFYICNIAFIILLGILSKEHKKWLLYFLIPFLCIGVIPFLSLSDFQFQKYQLTNLPKPYNDYFVTPYTGLPIATYYFPHTCWRARYMDTAAVPTQCINFGMHYSPITFDNPRLLSGEDYYVTQKLHEQADLDSLRITHNLKDIIVANDIVEEKGFGPLLGSLDITKTNIAKKTFAKNTLMSEKANQNFIDFSYKEKNKYDFFLYSPRSVVNKPVDAILDNTLDIHAVPVMVDNQQLTKVNYSPVSVAYKISPDDPTVYYVKITSSSLSHFLLQLNQTFSPWWKIKWVDSTYYNSLNCINSTHFSITMNTSCQYSAEFFNPDIVSTLRAETVLEKNHLRGNFIGNGWEIDPMTIPQYAKHGDNFYAIIVFEKQAYYTIAIFITCLTILFVFIGMSIQSMVLIFKQYEERS